MDRELFRLRGCSRVASPSLAPFHRQESVSLTHEHDDQALTDPDRVAPLVTPHFARKSCVASILEFHWWSR